MATNQLMSINHIVVLMLENRSFDHMLGFLYQDRNNVSLAGQPFEGLAGTESNLDAHGNKVSVFPILPTTPNAYFMPGADPGEGYTATNQQLFGKHTAPTPAVAKNTGFVTDYAATLAWESKNPSWSVLPGTVASQIMGIYTPATLPVLSGLARGYAVCDHWFSSAPTETMPNRAFAGAATSQGHMDDKTHSFTSPSIFGLLTQHQLGWAIYGYSQPPKTRLDFADTANATAPEAHFGVFTDFKTAAAAGTLPPYTFLEPSWESTGNSQHPNYDVALGEQLIQEVYYTLRNGPAWNQTLLIVTYDEHGGCYDHVPPPGGATPPDNSVGEFGFDFTRFGVRVPTVLISPLIVPGTVFRVPGGATPLDHTSILKTVEQRWGLPALTARDAAAVDVGDVLTLTVPRTDDPLAGVVAPTSTGTNPSAALPSHLQRMYAEQVSQVADPDHEFEGRTNLQSNEDYRAYIDGRLAAWKISRSGQGSSTSIPQSAPIPLITPIPKSTPVPGSTSIPESVMEKSHSLIAGSERKVLPGAVSTGRANEHTVITVSLKLRRKQPLPPLTGRPAVALTRQQLAVQYGAAPADLDAVVSAFAPFGLTAVEQNAATRTVKLSGSVAAMEQAFQVKLFNYTHVSGDYRGRVGALSVPTAVKDIVQGVFGLDNRRVVRNRGAAASAKARRHMTSVPAAWYVPSELATHYNFPAGDGSGQTVGLLEFGGGYFASDLAAFCQLAKIAAPPTVVTLSTDGTATNAKDGAEGEVMLDIEVVAGVCPKAKIAVYFAQFTEQGWITALDAAVHDQTNDPGVISASWGESEDTDIWTVGAMTQVNETLQEAARIGVTVCIASGDDGSSDAVTDGQAHVDFPSASPYVLSVGGTTIPSKTGNTPDIVWKEGDGLRADNGGSTGGGVSTMFPRPAWQSGITIQPINSGAIVGRCMPDLAANADWNASPYLLYVDGGAQPNGGTSAASPLVAALVTLINAARAPGPRVGYLTPVLYQTAAGGSGTVGAAGCTDVVSGNNITATIGGFSAGPGYDAVSGWGTPNGQNLAQALAGVLPVTAPAAVNKPGAVNKP